MFSFIILTSIAVLLSFLSQNKKKDYLIYLSFAVLAGVMGLQDSISVDFPSYIKEFDDINRGVVKGVLIRSQEMRDTAIEYGWFLVNRIIGYIIPSFYVVSFTTSLFFCFSVARLIKDVVPTKYRWVATSYFVLSPMIFFMSAMRQAVAVGCFIFAVRSILNKKKWYIPVLWLLAGSLFHNTLLIALLFLLLLLMPDKNKELYVAGLCILFVVALFFGQQYKTEMLVFGLKFFSDNMDQYASYMTEEESLAYSFRSLMRIAFPFVFTIIPMCKAKGKDFYYLLLFAVGQGLYGFVGFMGNLQRIAFYLTIFAVASFMVASNHIKNQLVNAFFIGGILLLNLYMFYVMLGNEQYVKFLHYRTIFYIF